MRGAWWLSATSSRRRLPERRTPRSTQEARHVPCVDAFPGTLSWPFLSSPRPSAAFWAAPCRTWASSTDDRQDLTPDAYEPRKVLSVQETAPLRTERRPRRRLLRSRPLAMGPRSRSGDRARGRRRRAPRRCRIRSRRGHRRGSPAPHAGAPHPARRGRRHLTSLSRKWLCPRSSAGWAGTPPDKFPAPATLQVWP